MFRVPTVKTLERYFPGKGKRLRDVIQSNGKNPRTTLKYVSDELGFFGSEFIESGSNKQSPAIHYANTGDTYETTILYVNGNYVVGNWGSIVERGNYA